MNSQQLVQLTCQLIRFESTETNYPARGAAIGHVAKILNKSRLRYAIHEKNHCPNLVAVESKTKKPQLFLYSHLDVVPGEKSQFTPRISGDKLYGRGSGDMKSAAAVMIALYLKYAREKSLGLMLTTDEEVGGMNGVNFLLNSKGYSSQMAMVPDSATGAGDIVLSQKGILHIKVWSKGVAAHGARPFLGKNAIEELCVRLVKLQKQFPYSHKKGGWHTTLNIGKIRGGNQINQVPDCAEACLDIRYVHPQEKQAILKVVRSVFGSRFEILATGFPVDLHKTDLWIRKYAHSIQSVLKKPPRFLREEGGSDARFFAEHGIPVIISGVMKKHSHGQKEWCSIRDMKLLYQICDDFIRRYI